MSSYLPKPQQALFLFHPCLTWKHNILIAKPVFELCDPPILIPPHTRVLLNMLPRIADEGIHVCTTNLPNCTSSFHPSECFCNTPSNSLPSTTAFTMDPRSMFPFYCQLTSLLNLPTDGGRNRFHPGLLLKLNILYAVQHAATNH